MRNKRENEPYYGMGPIERRRAKIRDYIDERKEKGRQQREYFASSEESDQERLKIQRERNEEFIQTLKRFGIGFLIFALIYLLIRTMAGLW